MRGGNGHTSLPQCLLACALGWEMEVPIKTGRRPLRFYESGPREENQVPPSYKIDIANRPLKIGIEVDGGSHNTIKGRYQDKKKTDFLVSRGWTILRFKNSEVTEDLGAVVQVVLSTISKLKEPTPTSPTGS